MRVERDYYDGEGPLRRVRRMQDRNIDSECIFVCRVTLRCSSCSWLLAAAGRCEMSRMCVSTYVCVTQRPAALHDASIKLLGRRVRWTSVLLQTRAVERGAGSDSRFWGSERRA